MKRVHVYIGGRVQGVFFRAETRRAAKQFHLYGWVRNLPDGRVEALFEGEDKNIDEMIKWCHIGPPAARVDNVVFREEPYTGEFSDFTIEYY
ncbi:MAG TPA: acylphosphatase [Smithella sp.]|nr:acylphosphatase [Smithella sp.]